MTSQQMNPQTNELDDDPPIVAGTKRLRLNSWQKVGVAALIAFVFLAFIWIQYALQSRNVEQSTNRVRRPNTADFRPAPLLPVEEPAQPPQEPKSDDEKMSPEESPLFAYVNDQAGASASPLSSLGSVLGQNNNPPSPPPGQIVPPLAAKAGEASDAIMSRLKPTPGMVSQAALLPHPDMLITKGTIIPCTLQTAINTQLVGFVKCVLPEDVRSTTGNVVLLDRGTTIVGEIQVGLARGQKRVFILWDRAETPQHAIISLASPGTDPLGRSGVPGTVNNHFWQRFGSALMLSIVDGGLQAGTAYAGSAGKGSGMSFNNFESDGQRVADSALQSSINIPPTLEKNQGENVSIFVATDVDFSSVYQLGLVE